MTKVRHLKAVQPVSVNVKTVEAPLMLHIPVYHNAKCACYTQAYRVDSGIQLVATMLRTASFKKFFTIRRIYSVLKLFTGFAIAALIA